ncbi:M23 family metallopeptidase [Dactylosporangium sp. CA-052675]|uniref:M23 family metallopeptidase n=1 Tax=Dactylosporangium sp. CA-052675 TaxID=3239927 RepID=UPI003D921A51
MLKNLTRFGLLVLAATAVAAASTAIAAAASALSTPKRAAASSEPSSAFAAGFAEAPAEAPADGVFQAPLDGPVTVTRGFEPPSDRYAAGHRGVDLAGAPGQTVRSAGEGTVVFAGMVGGRPVVSVEHPGGVRTTYEPVSATVVRGQAVSRGTPLGTLRPGHPNCPVAACLHWGLRTDGNVYLDPLTLLRPARVRLLPLH